MTPVGGRPHPTACIESLELPRLTGGSHDGHPRGIALRLDGRRPAYVRQVDARNGGRIKASCGRLDGRAAHFLIRWQTSRRPIVGSYQADLGHDRSISRLILRHLPSANDPLIPAAAGARDHGITAQQGRGNRGGVCSGTSGVEVSPRSLKLGYAPWEKRFETENRSRMSSVWQQTQARFERLGSHDLLAAFTFSVVVAARQSNEFCLQCDVRHAGKDVQES
jgi:hypothetical protein